MSDAFTGFWLWFRDVSEFIGVLVLPSFDSGDPVMFNECLDEILLTSCAASLRSAVDAGPSLILVGMLLSVMDMELSMPLVEAV